ncbi:hypothetical protein Q0M94_06420 [Deinococcus radiomollis]|uniref:hypothetical protein n=1 Tax=Deinococcus radiomollis TaxID=468916 RepID=UPI0038929D5F
MTPHATNQMRRHRLRLTDILRTISGPDLHFIETGRHTAERRIASGCLLRVVYLLRPHPVVITTLRLPSVGQQALADKEG